MVLEQLSVLEIGILPEVDLVGRCRRDHQGQLLFHPSVDLVHGHVGCEDHIVRGGKLLKRRLALCRLVQLTDHVLERKGLGNIDAGPGLGQETAKLTDSEALGCHNTQSLDLLDELLLGDSRHDSHEDVHGSVG